MNLEDRVRTVLRQQSEALPRRDGRDVATISQPRGSLRRWYLAAVAASLVVVAGAIALAVRSDEPSPVATEGEVPASDPSISTTAAPEPAPETTTTVATRPIRFDVNTVLFEAGSLVIEAGGQRFTGNPAFFDGSAYVGGDPSHHDGQTTLEVTWFEHGVEMRFHVYASSSRGRWHVYEIRTYDGTEIGEWIYYRDPPIGGPVGEAWTGNLDLSGGGSTTGGRLTIDHLRLEPFRRLPACDTTTTRFVVDPGFTEVRVDVLDHDQSAGFGVNLTLVDPVSCTRVSGAGYTVSAESGDPAIATVRLSTPIGDTFVGRMDLEPSDAGETSISISVTDPATGEVVATAELPVIVE